MDYYCAICGKKIKDIDNMHSYYSPLFKEKIYVCKEHNKDKIKVYHLRHSESFQGLRGFAFLE